MSEKKITAKQAAELLNASRATISSWCRKGKFPNAVKEISLTGEEIWLIPETDLQGMIVKMGRPKKDK